MDRVFSLLPKVLRKRGLHEHAEGALVVLRADRWMAEKLPHLHGVVRVEKLVDGTLFVTCTHSVALQECQGMMEDLRVYLLRECSFAPVSDIRLSRR